MTFVSYTQNCEDVTLYRALKYVDNGFYVDVSAQDPIVDSVTKAFYERGWRGINIEPVDYWFTKLLADRPEDHNVKVAAAAEAGILKFYEVVGTGMSTSDASFAAKHAAAGFDIRECEVPARRLDEICDELSVIEIHFLKIDVEGAECAVLAGIDLMRIRPWIILLESTEPNSMVPTHEQWEELLIIHGYVFVYFDGLNRYYVPWERERQLKTVLSTPPNYFDHFIRHSERLTEKHAQRMEAEAIDARSRIQLIENELTHLRAQSNILREDVANAMQYAAHLEDELAGVYRSLSWRMTASLRVASLLLKRFRCMIGPAVFKLISLQRHSAQRVLSALAHVRGRAEGASRLLHIRFWSSICGRFRKR